MYLKDLILALESLPADRVVRVGFGNPHSYRGVYEHLAFEREDGRTVADLLACCFKAMGHTYTGWKGGEFVMGEYSSVYLAYCGHTGEEIGPTFLALMLEPEPDDA